MKLRLYLFSFFFIILILFLYYKIAIIVTPLTPHQQETFNFVYNNQPLWLNYTSNEVSHLSDVKNVTFIANLVFYVSLAVTTLILTSIRNKKEWPHFLWNASIHGICFIVLTIIAIGISFETIFTYFHYLFFPQGNWTFPLNSLLIQTFPKEFFQTIAFTIFGLAITILTATAILSRIRIKRMGRS